MRFYQAISPHSAPILSEWLPQASHQEKRVGDSVRLIDVMKKVANEPSAAERRLISPVLRGTEKKSFSIKNSQLWRVSGGSNGQVGMSFRQLEEKRRGRKKLYLLSLKWTKEEESAGSVVNDLTAGLKASQSIKGSRATEVRGVPCRMSAHKGQRRVIIKLLHFLQTCQMLSCQKY